MEARDDGGAQAERDRARADDRRRQLQNVAAFVFIVLFVLGSWWVMDRVVAYSKNMACIQSGQRSCR